MISPAETKTTTRAEPRLWFVSPDSTRSDVDSKLNTEPGAVIFEASSARLLLRWRWAAAGLELVSALLAGPGRPLVLAALIAGHLLSNAFLAMQRRERPLRMGDAALAIHLDVLALTVVLALTGGASNPFSLLYFASVVVAAVILEARYVATTWAFALIGYAWLFSLPEDHSHHGGGGGFTAHLYGMFVAFAAASAVLAYFVARLSRALRDRERELRESQARSEQARRVASLTTLAAGAAHELGTPLGTIAVVAGELVYQLERGEGDPELVEDARLIRAEVARCRTILDAMSQESGEVLGEGTERVLVEALLSAVRASLAEGRAARLDAEVEVESLLVPERAFRQAPTSVINNAFDASPDEARVEVRFDAAGVSVRDQGEGMDAETLAHAQDPFFTTKEPGSGMGLGLFLTHATLDALGGALELTSAPGQGTEVRLRLPASGA